MSYQTTYVRILKRGVLVACACGALALVVFTIASQDHLSAQSPGVGAAADWMTYNGSYAGERFPSLQEITTSNVSQLKRLCTFDTGETGSFQTGPIAINGVLYFTTYTKTYAVDGATCLVKWTHERPAP